MGAVLHTLNIRLFEDDLRYIVDHADDRLIFLDASLAEADAALRGRRARGRDAGRPGRARGSARLRGARGERRPGRSSSPTSTRTRRRPCATRAAPRGGRRGCCTRSARSSSTRSARRLPDSMGIREADSVMPVVPMFHAMAWGIPYIAAMVGARQVLPGPDLTPRGLADLIASEGVTWSAGVPTIWNGFLELDPPPDLSGLRELKAGGSAVPGAPDPRLRGALRRAHRPGLGNDRDQPARRGLAAARGCRPLRRRGATRCEPPRAASCRWSSFASTMSSGGELQVRGPWIARAYYEDPGGDEKFTDDGWLRTGDVAELQGDAFIKLVDRTKDLVKSGGEWISSVELENALMAHPDVVEAAVIAVPDEHWGERPCACLVRRARRRSGLGRPAGAPRRAGGEVVDSGALRIHRRGAQDLGRQVRQEAPARPLRRQRRGARLRVALRLSRYARSVRGDVSLSTKPNRWSKSLLRAPLPYA